MRYAGFRRSKNVEDYTDPKTPVGNDPPASPMSINEMMALAHSELAKEAGADDVSSRLGVKKEDTRT